MKFIFYCIIFLVTMPTVFAVAADSPPYKVAMKILSGQPREFVSYTVALSKNKCLIELAKAQGNSSKKMVQKKIMKPQFCTDFYRKYTDLIDGKSRLPDLVSEHLTYGEISFHSGSRSWSSAVLLDLPVLCDEKHVCKPPASTSLRELGQALLDLPKIKNK